HAPGPHPRPGAPSRTPAGPSRGGLSRSTVRTAPVARGGARAPRLAGPPRVGSRLRPPARRAPVGRGAARILDGLWHSPPFAEWESAKLGPTMGAGRVRQALL